MIPIHEIWKWGRMVNLSSAWAQELTSGPSELLGLGLLLVLTTEKLICMSKRLQYVTGPIPRGKAHYTLEKEDNAEVHPDLI